MNSPQWKSAPEVYLAASATLMAAGVAIVIVALRYDFGSFDSPGKTGKGVFHSLKENHHDG